jgi:hypothetical protein
MDCLLAAAPAAKAAVDIIESSRREEVAPFQSRRGSSFFLNFRKAVPFQNYP